MKSEKISMRQPGYLVCVLAVFLLMMGVGVSKASGATASAPPSITVPANDLDGNYEVSWGASITAGVTYVLQEALNLGFSSGVRTVYTGNDLSASISGRSPGQTYYYRVQSTKSGLTNSAYRKAGNGCLVGPLPCEPPAFIDVSGLNPDNSFIVNWGASATSDAYYVLQEATASTFTTGLRIVYSGRLFNVAVTDRTPGKTYYYRVLARKFGLPQSSWASWTDGITIPVIPAPVAKTGQTYTAGVGDDGHRQKGVALPTPRFTNNGNGTVTDNLTGLIWLRKANCFATRSWEDALVQVEGLANGVCGLTDGSVAGAWRLPNARELSSLINFQYSGPALSNTAGDGQWTAGAPFTGVMQEIDFYYWSSSTYMDVPDGAWGVDLYDGYLISLFKTDLNYVWPVKGGQ